MVSDDLSYQLVGHVVETDRAKIRDKLRFLFLWYKGNISVMKLRGDWVPIKDG